MSDGRVLPRRWRWLPGLTIALAALLLAASAGWVWARGPEKFTLIALPDTQYYVERNPDELVDQVDWILSQRRPRNIVFVSHLGDVVEHYNSLVEWARADEILSRLIGVVPMGILPGNHDLSPEGGAASFNQYFGPDRFARYSWYGGGYPVGTNTNSYQLFSAGGYRLGPVAVGADAFLVLHLEFCPPPDVVAWANQVLEDHPYRHAILVTHGYLDISGHRNVRQPNLGCTQRTENTQYIYEQVVYPHPNVFLVLSGHEYDTQTLEGEARRVDSNIAGRPVYQLLSDFQRRPGGGGGWLRIIGFSQTLDEVIVRTYSPTSRSYEKDGESDFRIPYPAPLP